MNSKCGQALIEAARKGDNKYVEILIKTGGETAHMAAAKNDR